MPKLDEVAYVRLEPGQKDALRQEAEMRQGMTISDVIRNRLFDDTFSDMNGNIVLIANRSLTNLAISNVILQKLIPDQDERKKAVSFAKRAILRKEALRMEDNE